MSRAAVSLTRLVDEADRIISHPRHPDIPNDVIHQTAARILRQSPRRDYLALIESNISLNELFESPDRSLYLRELWGGVCDGGERIRGVFFIQSIIESIEENRIVFVLLGLDEYSVDTAPCGQRQKPASHAVCALAWAPQKESGTIRLHLLNSHGEDSTDHCEFERYITRRRVRTFGLRRCLDAEVMASIGAAVEGQSRGRYTVDYAPGPTHNYLGPNLQQGDSVGICFVYPLLFFEFLCNNVCARHRFQGDEPRSLPSTMRLIRRREWNTLYTLSLRPHVMDYARTHVQHRLRACAALDALAAPTAPSHHEEMREFMAHHALLARKALLSAFVGLAKKHHYGSNGKEKQTRAGTETAYRCEEPRGTPTGDK